MWVRVRWMFEVVWRCAVSTATCGMDGEMTSAFADHRINTFFAGVGEANSSRGSTMPLQGKV
jgi:hypothetical protein